MPAELWTNDGSGTVSAGGTTAPAAGTGEVWTVTVTNAFPAASNAALPPTQFYVCDPANELEKILVTNVSGGTFTVTRGADGTTPVAHTAGFTIVQVVTGATLRAVQLPVVKTFWYAPSGDTTGAADATAIQGAYTAGYQIVRLLPGLYYVNAMITIPTACSLIGAYLTQVDGASNYGAGTLNPAGTVIQAAGAFITGGPFPAAVIQCSNTTVTQQGAQVIQNISINAAACPAASGVIGILIHGAVGAGFIRDCVVYRSDGPCLKMEVDGGTTFWPIQWTITGCVFAGSRSSHGVLIGDTTDTNFIQCYAHDNLLDGWNVNGCTNTIWTGCRGETNHQNGFHFTGLLASGSWALLTGCMTQLNQQNGYLFDASVSTQPGNYQLTGCTAANDGQAAVGILAGYYDNGSKARVMLTGCSSLNNATGPAYGAYEGSVAFGMSAVGCLFLANTAATHDDATNTHALNTAASVPF